MPVGYVDAFSKNEMYYDTFNQCFDKGMAWIGYEEKHRKYEGKTLRVLIDGETGKAEYNLSSRTDGGRLVHLKGDPALIGQFADVKIVSSNTWALYGELQPAAAGGR